MNSLSSRTDYYLSKLNGTYDGELPTPVSREDYYLAKLCGAYDGELPAPVTRNDNYLFTIAENGLAGGGSADKFRGRLLDLKFISTTFTVPTT